MTQVALRPRRAYYIASATPLSELQLSSTTNQCTLPQGSEEPAGCPHAQAEGKGRKDDKGQNKRERLRWGT